MNLELTASELAFREELLDWLSAHLVGEFKDFDGQGGLSDDFGWDLRLAWDRELASGGWLGLGWPECYGGRPATLREEIIFHIETAKARTPFTAATNSVDLLGPALLKFGTAAQKARFIPSILRMEELWGQGFSEPDAGSDLAGVQTRCELDGDKWVINGQKAWTSAAAYADWLWVLCRSKPRGDGPGHRGLTMLLVPAHQPGVEIRPVRCMVNGWELCDTFFADAVTDADLVMGEVGQGWAVAMGGLGVERGTTLLPYQIRFEQEVDALIEMAKRNGRAKDPVARDAIVQAVTEMRVLRANNERLLEALLRNEDPGPVGAIGKLFASTWHQRLGELKMKLGGADSMIVGEGYDLTRWQRSFLVSRAETIYGGAAEVQRNILGERVLGLPR